MNALSDLKEQLRDEWIPAIYAAKIRSQRTRAVTLDVPQRENSAEILHTLLGIELKVGKRRFSCPDLSTARYMRVFARLGSQEFAIPYDITKISPLADELETAWHKALLLADSFSGDDTSNKAKRRRSALIKLIRTEIEAIGAGEAMPRFDKPTKQRNN